MSYMEGDIMDESVVFQCEAIPYRISNTTGQKDPPGFYIYRFLNKYNEVIYIGKTNQLRYRIYKHIRCKHDNLPQKCKTEIEKAEYIRLNNACDMSIMEIYLINYYQPKYNIFDNAIVGGIQLPIPKLWNEYNIETTECAEEYEYIYRFNNVTYNYLDGDAMYLTIKDLQDKLKIGKNTAYDLIRVPGFPVIKIGRKYLIPENKLDEYLEHYCGKEIFLK